MVAVVVASGVSFRLPNERALFQDLHLSLDQRRIALVGPNGVGKTTLARLLSGELGPSAGRIQRHGAVSLLSQRQAPEPVSVTEYLATRYGWSRHGEQLLDGIDREALCTTLSGGQWMRVRLAAALDDGYLILDEPTNDLDREGRQAVLGFLAAHQRGALLISHDRECLRACDAVLELSSRGLSLFGGGWDDYVAASERERQNAAGRLDVAKRERERARREHAEQSARQEKRAARGARLAARGGAPKILLGARKSAAQATTGKLDTLGQKRLDDAVREAHHAFSSLAVDSVMYAELVGTELPAQKLVARASGFNVHLGRWLYYRDLTFNWLGRSRVAVRGANGSGKSTLLRALSGTALETRGTLERGALRTLYLDQRLAFLDDDASVLDNVRARSTLSESEARTGLARFLFAKDAVFQRVSELSGGERLRAALASGFLRSEQPQLLLLDEPTNNLDLVNVEFLERVVQAFRGALLVVSHDPQFLENCALTDVLTLPGADVSPGGL